MKIYREQTTSLMVFRESFISNNKRNDYFHWHENSEFLYILSDGFKILIDGKLFEPKKGDIIFIGEYSVHCFICSGEYVNLSLGQFSLRLLLNEYANIKPIKTHITAEEIAEDPVFEKRLMHLIEIMKSIGIVKYEDINLFAKSVFSAFYFALMEKFPQTEQSESFKKERKDFYTVIEYINENISENITVTSIAGSLFMDRGKLSKVFTKYAGMSVNDYINSLRVVKVNEFLEKGYSLTDAALESGFQSIRTFNSVYKKQMGITPTEYINKKTNGGTIL